MRWSRLAFVNRRHLRRGLMKEKDVSSAEICIAREPHSRAARQTGQRILQKIKSYSLGRSSGRILGKYF